MSNESTGSGSSGVDLRKIARYGGIGLLVVVVLLSALFAIGVLGVPGGELADNQWGEVDNDSIEVITFVTVDNPNPFGLGSDVDVEYDIDLQDVRLAEGSGEDIEISSGENELEFTSDLFYHNLPAWWSAHLNNDEVSLLEADATIHASLGPLSGSPSTTIESEIDTDIEGALDDGFSEFEGSYPPAATLVEIEDVTTEWGTVTEDQTEILTTVTIHNPNPATPVPTPAFTGGLVFNDIPMAAWDADDVELLEAEEDAVIPPGETEERTFLVEMNNTNIPPWFASHVEQEEFTEMEVYGQLVFTISDQEFTVPPGDETLACEFDMTTGIFVDQDTDVALGDCVSTTLDGTDDGLLPGLVSGDDGDEGGLLVP